MGEEVIFRGKRSEGSRSATWELGQSQRCLGSGSARAGAHGPAGGAGRGRPGDSVFWLGRRRAMVQVPGEAPHRRQTWEQSVQLWGAPVMSAGGPGVGSQRGVPGERAQEGRDLRRPQHAGACTVRDRRKAGREGGPGDGHRCWAPEGEEGCERQR